MSKTLTPFLSMIVLLINACAPQVTAPAVPRPAATEVINVPVKELPTETAQTEVLKSYINSAFGLGFQFPSSWFGPEEYISDQVLRVEVGSDKVYPYGTGLEDRLYEFKNSYYVVVQYSRNAHNQYWKDIYQSLLTLQDGESLSDAHGVIIRVGQLDIGDYAGIEYISTLPLAAQTEPMYSRQVILFDGESNLLSITGTPNNVDFSLGENWRDAYQMIDDTNLEIFHKIIESITIESRPT